jgi:hypothetical protein
LTVSARAETIAASVQASAATIEIAIWRTHSLPGLSEAPQQ